MSDSTERQFPPRCPGCGDILATSAVPHCDTTTRQAPCGWLRCRCKTVLDAAGNHWPIRQATA